MPQPMPKCPRSPQILTALMIACGVASQAAAAQSTPAPSTPPASQAFQGCVQPSPTDKTTLILSAETTCAKLTGKFSATDLSGHLVDLKGVLTARTPAAPASIRVDSVTSVGKACSDVCSLHPPGTRGLGRGGETPGKEGGTPGEAPTPAPPPQ
jgi:hypothetical protein